MPRVRFNQTRNQILAVLLATGVGCCSFSGCAQSGPSNNPPETSRATIKAVQATVHRDIALEKVTPRRLDSERLAAVQFIDSDRGWIASANGSLYRTVDRGETWTKRRIPLPSGAVLSSFSFVNSTSGWLAAQKNGTDVLDPNSDEFWIMHSADGGDTWAVQHNGKGAQIERIRFFHNTEGWAVGIRFVRREVLQAVPFILYTNRQGQWWTDVSERLRPDRPVNGITDVHSVKASEATIVTVHGRLFRTTNGGADWHELSSFEHESTSTYFGRLAQTPSGYFWLLGGSDNWEGMSGFLAKQQSDGSWVSFQVDSYFRDGLFVSDKDIVVCGHTRPDGKPIVFGGHAEGVILRSSDAGQNWSVVYQNKNSASFNALAVNGGAAWVVGENGLVVRIELPTKNGDMVKTAQIMR